MTQLSLKARTWGGRREGAGRKPSRRPVGIPHRTRPEHKARYPVHVTLRADRGLPSLRAAPIFPSIRGALGHALRADFRILEFSVQRDHVHLLCEADSRATLSRGLQGVCIRLAKAVNRTLVRRGRVWSDRYHARALRTPREVRNALVYVLQNGRKHASVPRGFDPCSSAASFTGWKGAPIVARVVLRLGRPRTWLAAVGWKRHGLLDPDEAPGPTR